MRVGVVVLSLGDRPWWPIAATWLEFYCRRHGYDLNVVREPLASHVRQSDFDRFQNFGRAQKLGIGPFFRDYDRVIQIDDTCMVSPATPPLADIVPEGTVGCWVAGRYFPGQADFDFYAARHQAIYGRATPLPRESFYNSGVVVYSRKHAVLFDEATIPWDKIEADTWFPTQGYLSDRCEREGFALHDLGPEYNLIGSRIAPNLSAQADSVYIFHLTSALRNRLAIAQRIDRVFREKFPEAAVPAPVTDAPP